MEIPPEFLDNGHVDLELGWAGLGRQSLSLPSSNGSPIPPDGDPASLHRNLLACPEHFFLLCSSGWSTASEPLPNGVLGLTAMGLLPDPTLFQAS